jgi:hypothetical protein
MAVAEAYPDLKANENFLDLQQQLGHIETELQGARRYYNATVRDLNSTIQSFPDMLVARPTGFHRRAVLPGRGPEHPVRAPGVVRPPGGVMMRAFRAALAALLIQAAAPASAEEQITSFFSDVAVQEDSSLEVTETIDVVSEGNRIRRGIYRDFPTRYRGPRRQPGPGRLRLPRRDPQRPAGAGRGGTTVERGQDQDRKRRHADRSRQAPLCDPLPHDSPDRPLRRL